jgi:2-methylcitrate dehydratase PrpD
METPAHDAIAAIAAIASEPVTRSAARFVAELGAASLPGHVAEKARTCILYGFGIGLLCVAEDSARTAARAALFLDGPAGGQGATLLATGDTGCVSAAAFANAVLLHSRCQEDTSGTAHLGVVVLSVALAMLEAGWARPESFLPGIVAGYEVAGTLESAFGRSTMGAAHRASPLYGTFAAAATAARMLELPVDRIDAALANAAHFTGGILQSIPEGGDEWRHQVGAAAREGLLAAVLAREGSVSVRRAIEGPQGFARAFAGRGVEPGELKFGPDHRWILPEVTFKPYPVCAHNQTVALLGSQIHARYRPEQIAHVRLRISTYLVPGLLARGPFSRVADTLMSTAFCCACACVQGTVSMAGLSAFEAPAILGMLERIEVQPDAAIAYPAAAADITLRDGARVTLEEIRSFADFSLSREETVRQLERLCNEQGVPREAIACIGEFAFGREGAAISPAEIREAFRLARAPVGAR